MCYKCYIMTSSFDPTYTVHEHLRPDRINKPWPLLVQTWPYLTTPANLGPTRTVPDPPWSSLTSLEPNQIVLDSWPHSTHSRTNPASLDPLRPALTLPRPSATPLSRPDQSLPYLERNRLSMISCDPSQTKLHKPYPYLSSPSPYQTGHDCFYHPDLLRPILDWTWLHLTSPDPTYTEPDLLWPARSHNR